MPCPEEVARFLDAACITRLRAVLTTCYATDLRICEAVGLRPSDIDSGGMIVRVQKGKGRKHRFVMPAGDPSRLLVAHPADGPLAVPRTAPRAPRPRAGLPQGPQPSHYRTLPACRLVQGLLRHGPTLAIVRDAEALRTAMSLQAAYLPERAGREPFDYTSEASRRARGLEIWAAITSLGRDGVAKPQCVSASRPERQPAMTSSGVSPPSSRLPMVLSESVTDRLRLADPGPVGTVCSASKRLAKIRTSNQSRWPTAGTTAQWP